MYENRLKHPRNPLIAYMNINSLRNKIVSVWKTSTSREGFITKKIKEYETKVSETIASETMSKKRWFSLSVYRPPTPTNLDIFLKNWQTLSKAVNKYDNLIVMGDFNIDLNKTGGIDFGKLE